MMKPVICFFAIGRGFLPIFPVSGEEEVCDECRKKLRQQVIKSSQHGQLQETQNPNPSQTCIRDILFMPSPFLNDRKKAPDINTGKYQGQGNGCAPSPFEHGPENIFHGKQGGAGNNGEKQKMNCGIFH